jgi:hypothetical protein
MKPIRPIILVILAITAVVLCTLPFLFKDKKVIYVYTKDAQMNAIETAFVKALKTAHFTIIINEDKKLPENSYALWFLLPQNIADIDRKSTAKHNFVYSEEHYPFDWHEIATSPIILTPYQDLYEHYMRSNIKSALFNIKDNNASKRFHDIYQWIKENN